MDRICIYPKDIQRITGKSERHGRSLIKKMKQAFSKKGDQYITIEEFCKYTGLPFFDVQSKITN